MCEEFPDIDPLVPVVDDRYQSITVALDVENCIWVGKIRSRQHGAYGIDVRKSGLLENLPPAGERLRSIGMVGREAINCYNYVNERMCRSNRKARVGAAATTFTARLRTMERVRDALVL